MHWVSTYTPRDDSPPVQSRAAQSFVSFVHQHPCRNPNTQRIRRSGHGFRCFRHRFHRYSHFFVCLLTKTAKTMPKTANPLNDSLYRKELLHTMFVATPHILIDTNYK